MNIRRVKPPFEQIRTGSAWITPPRGTAEAPTPQRRFRGIVLNKWSDTDVNSGLPISAYDVELYLYGPPVFTNGQLEWSN